MLVEFRVKNFRSFRDEQTFSMVAAKADHTLPDNVLPLPPKVLGKENLVSSAVVYGANAHGKSNLVKALNFMETMVRKSATNEPVGDQGVPLHQPFRLDSATAGSPSELEITFIHEGVRYQYGFAVGRRRIYKEWLYAYPEGREQLWFYRTLNPNNDTYEWEYGSRFLGEKRHLEGVTRPDALYLSVGATFNHRQLKTVWEWFNDYLQIVYTTREQIIEWLNFTVLHTLEDESFHRKVQTLLCHADIGITDFSVTQHPGIHPALQQLPAQVQEEILTQLTALAGKSVEELNYANLQLRHKGQGGHLVLFASEEESNGTMRLFALAGSVIRMLEKGRVMVVDELDASLHPLLVQEIVKLFNNPDTNLHGAQLIFNTHDTTLLSLDLLRRDQIWFVEKNPEGASHLYPLLDFKPRNDAILAKNYLLGRYGAIPFVGGLPEGFIHHGETQQES